MINYRNIGHDWQLTKTQQHQLDCYYNDNKLLMECINQTNEGNDMLRQQIENTLLLPRAEIEKRKRETAE